MAPSMAKPHRSSCFRGCPSHFLQCWPINTAGLGAIHSQEKMLLRPLRAAHPYTAPQSRSEPPGLPGVSETNNPCPNSSPPLCLPTPSTSPHHLVGFRGLHPLVSAAYSSSPGSLPPAPLPDTLPPRLGLYYSLCQKLPTPTTTCSLDI